jgi:hypothetical protein
MRRLVGVLMACAVAGAAAGADLPLGHKDFVPTPERPVGWRGDGSGCFPGATPPTQWDGPSGKNILWKAVMPHQTHASPIVVGKKVITLADPHTILCLDADTGEFLWHNAQDQLDLLLKPDEAKRYRRLWDLFHRYFTNHGPLRRPPQKGMSPDDPKAVEAAGKELKAAGLPVEVNEDGAAAMSEGGGNATLNFVPFFTKVGLWTNRQPGFAATQATPVSDGTRVWVYYATNTAACYDLKDGRVVWMKWLGECTALPADRFFPSPLLVDGVLAVLGGGTFRGLKPDTGDVLWEHDYKGSNYSVSSPAVVTLDGRPLLVTWEGWVVRPRDGKVLTTKREITADARLRLYNRGNSPFTAGDGRYVQQIFPMKPNSLFAAFCLKAAGDGAVTNGSLWVAQPVCYDHDDGTSAFYGGYVYVNNGWDVIELATGKVHSRELAMPSGGYPGVNVAGKHLVNFDGAASAGLATLGPEGRVAAVNHLLAGYKHAGRVVSGKGGNRSQGDRLVREVEWWKQVDEARAKGIIGWVGRHHALGLGDMTADPFFHGDRIYVRTYTHLYCIGPKP